MERRVIFFEDVHEGGEVPPFMVERLTRMDLVRYAGCAPPMPPDPAPGSAKPRPASPCRSLARS